MMPEPSGSHDGERSADWFSVSWTGGVGSKGWSVVKGGVLNGSVCPQANARSALPTMARGRRSFGERVTIGISLGEEAGVRWETTVPRPMHTETVRFWDWRIPQPHRSGESAPRPPHASRSAMVASGKAADGTVLPLERPGPHLAAARSGSSIRNRRGHSAGTGQARPQAAPLRRAHDRGGRAGHAGTARAQAGSPARGPGGGLDRLGPARSAGDRSAWAGHAGA